MNTRTRRAPALPYPELPPTPLDGGTRREIFWRAAWLRDEAQAHALEWFLRTASVEAVCGRHQALNSALIQSLIALEREAAKSLATLIDAGGLLYAWLPEGGAA